MLRDLDWPPVPHDFVQVVQLLNADWAQLTGAGVGAGVGDGVGAGVGDGVGAAVGNGVGAETQTKMRQKPRVRRAQTPIEATSCQMCQCACLVRLLVQVFVSTMGWEYTLTSKWVDFRKCNHFLVPVMFPSTRCW